ncbi:MAG: hydrogenase formation protein HypD [Deltaproteobacteria bacterium]|nr:hydrogenase formation protein HypD [Deltaproteobacteria bacterium]
MLSQTQKKTADRTALLLKKINAITLPSPINLMEVCGTHTMAIARHAIKGMLSDQISLISGPGCPVCVTSVGEIEMALSIASIPNTVIFTFGDMMRVPGVKESLSHYPNVRVAYSPFDAVAFAKEHPRTEVAFLGIGFETTIPVVGAAMLQAKNEGLKNFSVLSMHKLVPPALTALLDNNKAKINGLICPGHVSVIIGANAYRGIQKKYNVPCVITGFEPADILEGIYLLVRQIQQQTSRVEIQYARAVTMRGNLKAMNLMHEIYEVCPAHWRGIGVIPKSGLQIRTAFSLFDAKKRFGLKEHKYTEPKNCLCGRILQGLAIPTDCKVFAKRCTPNTPVGPCMVSSEGACSAVYKYETSY